jgi:aconitate hydratase
VTVTVHRASGASETFEATAAVETALEVEILRGGGIIPLILRRAVRSAAASRSAAQNFDIAGSGEPVRRQGSPVDRR